MAHGGNANARAIHELTALHYAAEGGHTRVVSALLKGGADANPLTDDGRTPLHFAAGEGHADTVETLLANGANAASNRYVPGRFMDWNVAGLSASDVAQRNGHDHVASMIRQFAAGSGSA